MRAVGGTENRLRMRLIKPISPLKKERISKYPVSPTKKLRSIHPGQRGQDRNESSIQKANGPEIWSGKVMENDPPNADPRLPPRPWRSV